MVSPNNLYHEIKKCGFSHVVWIPDSATGLLEPFLEEDEECQLVRVCREGAGFAIAGGLLIGGKRPLVIIQCTGLFESGDSLRNMVHDLKLPIRFIVGYRSYEKWKANPDNADSARKFVEPILRSWEIPFLLIEDDSQAELIQPFFQRAEEEGQPSAILLGEP